jgi:hypothetical protein
MEWARILAYITGTVDQELLLRPRARRDHFGRYPGGQQGTAQASWLAPGPMTFIFTCVKRWRDR